MGEELPPAQAVILAVSPCDSRGWGAAPCHLGSRLEVIFNILQDTGLSVPEKYQKIETFIHECHSDDTFFLQHVVSAFPVRTDPKLPRGAFQFVPTRPLPYPPPPVPPAQQVAATQETTAAGSAEQSTQSGGGGILGMSDDEINQLMDLAAKQQAAAGQGSIC